MGEAAEIFPFSESSIPIYERELTADSAKDGISSESLKTGVTLCHWSKPPFRSALFYDSYSKAAAMQAHRNVYTCAFVCILLSILSVGHRHRQDPTFILIKLHNGKLAMESVLTCGSKHGW